MREFDYTVVTSGSSRLLIDWSLNRAFDITGWSNWLVQEFQSANYARRSELLAECEIVAMHSWLDDVNPWEHF